MVDIPGLPFGVAPGCQKAQLRVGPCPVARPPKYRVGFSAELDPDKGAGHKAKAPCLHHAPRLLEHGHGDPEEQGAIVGGQFGHGQSLDVLNGHGGVVPVSGVPCAVFPRRVGVDDVIVPYSPNISFTTLSAPFTSPVKISILKINCPMYCHAMVTAGRLASAAGVLLDRNAE